MIPGIASQVETILPRGTLASTLCVDDETFLPSFIAFDAVVTQLLSSAFAVDADSFFSPRLPQVLNPGLVASNESIIAPSVRSDLVLAPMLYFADDALSLPSIAPVAAPGTVLPNLYNSDDAIFSPLVVSPGLRPAPVNDFETLFTTSVSMPLTLVPTRHTDLDSMFAPIVRIGFLLPSFVDDADVIYAPIRTSPNLLGAAFVIDSDVNYVPAVGRILNMSLVAGDDVIYAPSETGGDTLIAPIASVSDADVIYAPAFVYPTTFDNGTLANVGLSNGDLTATHSNTTNNSGARSIAYKSSGKYYFEVTMTTTHGANDCVGVILSTATYSNLVTSGISCVATYKSNGNIFANNTTSKTLGAIAAGDVIGVAVDLTARKAWLRKNSGNWNGLALASENPNTGVGGVTIGAGSFAPVVGFGGAGTAINDAMTANFGQAAYGSPAPTGFLNWTT